MSEAFDFIIHGGAVYVPGGPVETDVGVRAGRIAEIGDLKSAKAAERFDASGLTVLPGCIDDQVHFREPGLTHKEDLESGTRGAALGGITTVFEMPNTSPSTTTVEAMADKVKRATGRSW
ncbi:MAG: amidohydrolase family protein, partial [Rhodospirillaceae bacterium]